MRWITPESFIKFSQVKGEGLSKLTRGLEHRGEAHGPESLVFAQLPPLFNMNLCESLAIFSYVGREA